MSAGGADWQFRADASATSSYNLVPAQRFARVLRVPSYSGRNAGHWKFGRQLIIPGETILHWAGASQDSLVSGLPVLEAKVLHCLNEAVS